MSSSFCLFSPSDRFVHVCGGLKRHREALSGSRNIYSSTLRYFMVVLSFSTALHSVSVKVMKWLLSSKNDKTFLMNSEKQPSCCLMKLLLEIIQRVFRKFPQPVKWHIIPLLLSLKHFISSFGDFLCFTVSV